MTTAENSQPEIVCECPNCGHFHEARGWSSGSCEDCRKVKPDVRERICPYDQDVEGKTTKVRICDACEHERGMAI